MVNNWPSGTHEMVCVEGATDEDRQMLVSKRSVEGGEIADVEEKLEVKLEGWKGQRWRRGSFLETEYFVTGIDGSIVYDENDEPVRKPGAPKDIPEGEYVYEYVYELAEEEREAEEPLAIAGLPTSAEIDSEIEALAQQWGKSVEEVRKDLADAEMLAKLQSMNDADYTDDHTQQLPSSTPTPDQPPPDIAALGLSIKPESTAATVQTNGPLLDVSSHCVDALDVLIDCMMKTDCLRHTNGAPTQAEMRWCVHHDKEVAAYCKTERYFYSLCKVDVQVKNMLARVDPAKGSKSGDEMVCTGVLPAVMACILRDTDCGLKVGDALGKQPTALELGTCIVYDKEVDRKCTILKSDYLDCCRGGASLQLVLGDIEDHKGPLVNIASGPKQGAIAKQSELRGQVEQTHPADRRGPEDWPKEMPSRFIRKYFGSEEEGEINPPDDYMLEIIPLSTGGPKSRKPNVWLLKNFMSHAESDYLVEAYEQLLTTCAGDYKGAREKDPTSYFPSPKKVDKDNDQVISVEEIKNSFKISEREATDFAKNSDFDKDGTLEYGEYITIATNLNGGRGFRLDEDDPELNRGPPVPTFRLLDTNFDGKLSRSEVVEVLQLDDAFFDQADLSRDNFLSEREFDRFNFTLTDKMESEVVVPEEDSEAAEFRLEGRRCEEVSTILINQLPGRLKKEHQVIKHLTERASNVTAPLDLSFKSFNPQVVKYGPGGHFNWHYDETATCMPATLMVYLNDVPEENGGATYWRYGGAAEDGSREPTVKIQPTKGDAAFWVSCVLGEKRPKLDVNTQHTGSPMLRGEKWILNFFFDQSALHKNGKKQLPKGYTPVVPEGFRYFSPSIHGYKPPRKTPESQEKDDKAEKKHDEALDHHQQQHQHPHQQIQDYPQSDIEREEEKPIYEYSYVYEYKEN